MSARIVLFLAAGIGAGLSAAELRTAPRPGEAYPSLVLPSLADGAPLSITHFRGKKVLLLQFASW
jgi:hypothetical protein